MTEQRLQDAKIVVKIDTTAAEQELEKFDKRRGESDERSASKRERDARREDGKAKGNTNVAVIPGKGLLRQVISTFIQIELAKLGLAVGAGAIGDADIPAPFKAVTDRLAKGLESASEAIQSIQSQLAAILGTSGDIIDVARAQKLLLGEVDTKALGEIALERGTIRSVEATLESRRKTVGRVAAGSILTDVAGQGAKAIGEGIADALGNAEIGAPR